jgi:hypothetical protein
VLDLPGMAGSWRRTSGQGFDRCSRPISVIAAQHI